MKLLVTGDFHTKKENLLELKTILTQILAYLQQCDAIAILGDIFNKSNPDPNSVELIISFLKQIPLNKMIYIISGNHDERRDENATVWIPLEHPNIVYHPYILTTILNGKSIRLAHTNVSESKMGPNDIQLTTISYKHFKEDIVLLGHIHKSQIISQTPLVLHPGSPYYTNFGERNDKKGIYIINIDKDITCEFAPLDVMPMYQLDIKQNELDSIDEKLQTIPQHSKVKLVFNFEAYKLETTAIIASIVKKYRSKFHVFKYEVKIKPRMIEIAKTITQDTIEQLLDKFCKKENVEQSIKNLLGRLLK